MNDTVKVSKNSLIHIKLKQIEEYLYKNNINI